MECHPHSYGLGLSASFASAAAARHALVLDDLAIKVVLGLDNAAKEHPAVHAVVGALEAGVVRSTLSSSWRGCGTLLVSIGDPPCGTGSGVRHHLRAIPLSDSSQYTRLAHFMQLVYNVFAHNFDVGACDEYTDVDGGRRTQAPELAQSARVADWRPCKGERRSSERRL